MSRWTPIRKTALVVLVLVICFVLAALSLRSASDSGPQMSTSGAARGDAEPMTGGAEYSAATDKTEAPALSVQPANEPLTGSPTSDARADRSIIFNTSLSVRADDPELQIRNATNAVQAAGGRVASADNSADGSQHYIAVFRVPVGQFPAVVAQLSALGKVESINTSENDVTAQLVDLESRIANAKAAVDRMRALMAEAKTVGEVIAVESQLTQREAEYESFKAQSESTKSAVQMATISLTLTGPDAVTSSGSRLGFIDGLRDGWEAALTTLSLLAVTLGFLLPLLPLPLIGFALIWLVRRSLKRRTANAQKDS